MADKYIIHGSAFNGNGTSSAEATVDGGVGAWNSLNVFDAIGTPNYGGGSLVAGDTVFIRSKDASGNNLTRTLSATATLGSAAATSSAWVTWVLDNGVVWPGIDGTLTYNCPSTYAVNARNFNRYVAMTQDAFRIVEANAAASYKSYFSSNEWATDGLLFDFSIAATASGAYFANPYGWRHDNLHVISRRRALSLITASSYGKSVLVNPNIEVLEATSSALITVGGHLHIVGGRVSGAGAVSGSTLLSVEANSITDVIGLSFPRQMNAVSPLTPTSSTYSVNIVGTDGALGGLLREGWGLADSREDNNYPKLNAVLPDSANTPWAWKLCPMTTSEQHPLKMPMSQYFNDTAGTREITVSLLVATTLTNVNKRSVWISVDYVDNTTGLKKSITTRDFLAGALDVSTANWTATTYGATSLLKRKLSAVTPTAIKPNTPITVVLWGTVKAVSTTDELGDIMFLDPEFSVNVP